MCSPVNLLHIFRTPFTKNTSGWLLLIFVRLVKLFPVLTSIPFLFPHTPSTMNTHGIPYAIYYEYPWYPIYQLLWIPMVSHIPSTMNTHGIPYTIYYEYPWYPIYHLLWIPVVSHIPSTMNILEALKCILLKNGTINFSYNDIRIFRRVARNIWGQEGFLQVQILNSSERLNCMQTIQRLSFKHECLYQMQIILADIQFH